MLVETDKLLNATAVAERCGVLPSAVTNWQKRPSVPFPEPRVVICGTAYWLDEDIDAWHADRRAKKLARAERLEAQAKRLRDSIEAA